MIDEKWEALKEELGRKFEIEEQGFEDLMMDTADGPVKQGTVEKLIFESPLGRIKLTRETRPVVLGKKEFYSHQQGKAARIEYQFSDSEFSHKIVAYKWDDDNDPPTGGWKPIDAAAFN